MVTKIKTEDYYDIFDTDPGTCQECGSQNFKDLNPVCQECASVSLLRLETMKKVLDYHTKA